MEPLVRIFCCTVFWTSAGSRGQVPGWVLHFSPLAACASNFPVFSVHKPQENRPRALLPRSRRVVRVAPSGVPECSPAACSLYLRCSSYHACRVVSWHPALYGDSE